MNGHSPEGGKAANECPPVAPTTEGPRIAWTANAPDNYNATGAAGKGNFVMPEKHSGRPDSLPVTSPPIGSSRITFRAPDGRVWAYTGKRGRVLYMLATMGGGVTQWDCLPWHTRLGASVHVLRCDGLVIDTEREGDCRHARYTLRTAGSLIIQETNRGAATTRARNAQ